MHILFAGLEGPREARLKHYCFKCVAFDSDKYVRFWPLSEALVAGRLIINEVAIM